MTGIHQAIAASGFGADLFAAIQSAGLTANLRLCLDAGSRTSYGGTGQTWTDLSGSGNNYNLGTTTSAESTDPTWNSLGYFSSVDGAGSTFTAAGTDTWNDSFHKANAKFTIVAICATGGPAFNQNNADQVVLFNTSGSTLGAPNDGVYVSVRRSSLYLDYASNAAGGVFVLPHTQMPDPTAPSFVGLATDLQAGNVAAVIQKTSANWAVTNSTVTANNAVASRILNTSANGRLYAIAVWDAALTSAQMASIRDKLPIIFPLSTCIGLTANRTFPVPTGATQAVMELWGAPGAISGTSGGSSQGGGSSAGGYCKLTRAVLSGEWGTNLTYTAGGGGTPSVGVPGTGGNGQSATLTGTLNGTAFTMTAGGGKGGSSTVIGSAAGGGPSTGTSGGDINLESPAASASNDTTGLGGAGGSLAAPIDGISPTLPMNSGGTDYRAPPWTGISGFPKGSALGSVGGGSSYCRVIFT